MTLSELAAFVTMKVGQTDDESVAACKDFIGARYRMIWDGALWADSQALVTVQAVISDPGLVEFPEDVGRVIHLRNTGTQTDVLGTSIGTLFDFNAQLFSDTGAEQKFVHTKSSPVPVARDVGHITFGGANVNGGGSTATLTVVGSVRGTVVREIVEVPLDGVSEATTVDFTGKVGSDLDNSGTGRYFIAHSDATTTIAIAFVISGSSTPGGTGATYNIPISLNAGDNAEAIAAACLDSATLLAPYFSISVNGNTATFTALSVGPLTDAVDVNTSLPLSITQGAIGSDTTTGTEFDDLYFITSELFQGFEIPMTNGDGDSLGSFTGTIFPTDSPGTVSGVEKVRVYPVPETAQTYLAHVKTRCVELDSDDAEPALSGIENALIAFAQSDMLERQRQYNKAQAKMAEGQMMVKEMLDLELNQQSYEARIIPADTSGLSYYGDQYPCGFWGKDVF